ncbi:MAG: HpaII family restriction endonuclease [Desulfovibrionaceae bacterium]
MAEEKIKFIDLFAGIGGFHYAFHQLGCECVFASELDESARVTYERNYSSLSPNLFLNNMFNDDIRKISPVEIPDFDILCAGFPCQPFSQAGHKKGFSDGKNSERGNLFFNIVDIIEVKKPKAFFLENVRGIVNHNNGKTFQTIQNILENELGYSFYFQIVKASDYGLPQHRPRAFMIGFRDEGLLKGFVFPEKKTLKFNMSDVFGGKCSREVGFTLRVGGGGSNINDRRNWDSYLVDGKIVRIQPEHALKMQGFPDTFFLPSSKREAMKQLGNSVAVDAVKACAESLINHLRSTDSRNKKENIMTRTRNKGEWTELYSFLKIILDKKLYLSDKKLNKTEDFFYVHKVSTLNIQEEVSLESDGIKIARGKLIQTEDDNAIFDINDIDNFKNAIQAHNKTFLLDEVELIFQKMGIHIVNGGNSNQKADIILDVSRNGYVFENEGFGIKSYLGSKPTLLNASGSNTNFIYEIKCFNDALMTEVNAINSRMKIKDRISYIISNGGSLEFSKIEAETMQYNLSVLDRDLPLIISKMLLNFYLNRQNKLSNNLESLYNDSEHSLHTFIDLAGSTIKVKRLLLAILLGIFSGRRWDGKFLANGTIVVKDDGSQVAFHITKKDILEDYLFDIIKFDTPSTTRHRFASVYKERDGKFYFKLNLQLRF